MKNNSKRLFFYIILTASTYACQNELYVNLGESRYSKEVMQAKDWYELNRPGGSSFMLIGPDKPPLEVKPDWEQSTVSSNDKERVVETFLYMKGALILALPETKQKFDETQDKRYQYASSYTRLIIKTRLDTGKTDGFFMTVVSSVDYIELTDFKPFGKVGYIDRDKRFTGQVKFHNLDGEFVNGWGYKNGKIISSLKPVND